MISLWMDSDNKLVGDPRPLPDPKKSSKKPTHSPAPLIVKVVILFLSLFPHNRFHISSESWMNPVLLETSHLYQQLRTRSPIIWLAQPRETGTTGTGNSMPTAIFLSTCHKQDVASTKIHLPPQNVPHLQIIIVIICIRSAI